MTKHNSRRLYACRVVILGRSVVSGVTGQIRTDDTKLFRLMLYRLSYSDIWQKVSDLNGWRLLRASSVFETDAFGLTQPTFYLAESTRFERATPFGVQRFRRCALSLSATILQFRRAIRGTTIPADILHSVILVLVTSEVTHRYIVLMLRTPS